MEYLLDPEIITQIVRREVRNDTNALYSNFAEKIVQF